MVFVLKVDSGASGTTITHYLGKIYERVQKPSGVIEHKHYLSAGGTTVLYTERSNAANDTRYLHQDHLGSTDVITDEQGQVVERLSFDAWGARRNSNWITAPDYGFHLVSLVTRGFTGHNQDDAVGLIDMNARLYDAKLGRFLQPDTFVQHPYTTQGMNRYTYVTNNPLSFTDPTGHFLKKLFKGIKKLFKNKVFRAVVAVVAAVVTAGWAGAAMAKAVGFQSIAAATVGAGATWGSAIAVGAAMGAVGGFASTLVMTGDVGAALRAGFIGGVTGAAFSAVSFGLSQQAWFDVNHQYFDGNGNVLLSPSQRLANGVARIAISGTASRLNGGKFANGAQSAAYAFLFSEAGELAKSRTDRLKYLACREGTAQRCVYDERGVLRTDGTRGSYISRNLTQERNWLTETGMGREGYAHSYDSGGRLMKYYRHFVTDVSKIHDMFNSVNYSSTNGLYMSRGVGFDSAFQLYSFAGMPVAAAATLIGKTEISVSAQAYDAVRR